MSTRQGAVILGCAGPRLLPDEAAFFRDADPWGFTLFARNVEDPAQLRRLTADLRASVGRNAPIFTDQEGGRVQRLRAPHWREWTPPLDFVRAAGERAERALWLRSRLIAHELRGVGIDGNYAPTLDVARPETHPFLRNRCLSDDPATVIRLGRAVAQGHLDGGVLPVVKHMPGHGRGVADSHFDLPETDASLPDLTATDFAPFAALADLPVGMSAHVVYRALDDLPGTQSARVIAHVRDRIGFDGLLLTDDLSMQALSGTIADRAAASLRAGCDVALYCKAEMPDALAVVAAAGRMTRDAQARADRALDRRHPPEPVDIAALEAELRSLAAGDVHAG
ncbi:MAG: glycoside hydrolase family 3 N-terminal domain-containing protein [Gemmobacter sp.]